MKKNGQKIVSILLALMFLIQIVPTSIYALGVEGKEDVKEHTTNELAACSDSEMPCVVCEIENKRTEYSKTFKMDDGSFCLVESSTPIHIKQNKGFVDSVDSSHYYGKRIDEVTTLIDDNCIEVSVKETNESNQKNIIQSETHSNVSMLYCTCDDGDYIVSSNVPSNLIMNSENFPVISLTNIGEYVGNTRGVVSANIKLTCSIANNEENTISAYESRKPLYNGTIIYQNEEDEPYYFDNVFAQSQSDYNIIDSFGDYYWDITDLYYRWESGVSDVNGVFLFPDEMNDVTVLSEYFILNYTEIDAMDDDYKNYEMSNGRSGDVYVNELTFTPVVLTDIITCDCEILPVDIKYLYSDTSDNYAPQQFGYNWGINYSSSLQYISSNYIWNDFEGKRIIFSRTNPVIYNSFDATLEKWTSDDDEYVLWVDYTRSLSLGGDFSHNYIESNNDNYIYRFNHGHSFSANVVSIEDDYGNTIDISYNSGNYISYITDGSGRKYVFNYEINNNNSFLYLSSIEVCNSNNEAIYVDNRKLDVKFEYNYLDTKQELVSIEYPDGEIVYFSYNATGRLTSITNIDGITVYFSYNSIIENGQNKELRTISKCEKKSGSNTISTMEFGEASPYEREIIENGVSSHTTIAHFSHDLKCISRTIDGKIYYYSYDVGNAPYNIPDIPENSNIVKNSDFETKLNNTTLGKKKPKYWSLFPDDTSVISRALFAGEQSNYRLVINGDIESKYYAEQNITSSEIESKYGAWSSNDIWVLKVEGKVNDPIPMESRFWGIEVIAYYGSNIPHVVSRIGFDNSIVSSWQKCMTAFKVPLELNGNILSSLGVRCSFERQNESAAFDNVELALVERIEPKDTSNCPCGDRCTYDGSLCPCDCQVEPGGLCNCVSCNAKTYYSLSNTDGNVLGYIKTDGIRTMSKTYGYTPSGDYISDITDENGHVYSYSYDEDSGFLESIADSAGSTDYSYSAFGLLNEICRVESVIENDDDIVMGTEFNYTGDKVSKITHNGFSYSIQYDDAGNYIGFSQGANTPYVTNSYYNYDTSMINQINYCNGDSIVYNYENGKIESVSFVNENNQSQVAFSYTYTDNKITQIDDEINGYTTLYNYETEESGNPVTYEIYCYRSPNIDDVVFAKEFDDGNTVEKFYSQTFSEGEINNNYYGTSGITISSSVAETAGKRFTSASASDYFGRNVIVNNLRISDDQNNSATLNSSSAVIQDNNLGQTVAKTETFKYYNDDAVSAGTEIIGFTNRVSNLNSLYSAENNYSYIYDDCGNITHIYSGLDENNRRLINRYIYDNANQLIREDYKCLSDDEKSKTTVYEYDAGGNIKKKTIYAYTIGDLGIPTDVIDYSYNGLNKDILTLYDGNTITYDEMGNPLSYNGNTFTWRGRQLISYQTSDNYYTFGYDSEGNCISKTSYYLSNGVPNLNTANKTEFVWEKGKLIYQYVAGSTLTIKYLYDQSGSPYGLITDGDSVFAGNHMLYYVKNAQGDVERIVNAENGMTIATYHYDAWGNMDVELNISSFGAAFVSALFASNNMLTYRSYPYDYNLKLYYLKSRFYSSEWCRFINFDSMESRLSEDASIWMANLFCYCQNNPVNYLDPYGYATSKNIFFVYNRSGNDFASQAKWMRRYAYSDKNCVSFNIQKVSEFKSKWSNLCNYTINDIHLYLHGGIGCLYFNGESMRIDDIDSLEKVNLAGKIYLYSCNGGTNNQHGESVAGAICKKASGATVRAVVNGCVYYRAWYQLINRKPLTKEKGAYWADFHYGKYKGKHTVYSTSIGRTWKL